MPEDFRDEELQGDDFQGSKFELDRPPDQFTDEDLEGSDFEGNRLEFTKPHDEFKDEELEGDDFEDNQAAARVDPRRSIASEGWLSFEQGSMMDF